MDLDRPKEEVNSPGPYYKEDNQSREVRGLDLIVQLEGRHKGQNTWGGGGVNCLALGNWNVLGENAALLPDERRKARWKKCPIQVEEMRKERSKRSGL